MACSAVDARHIRVDGEIRASSALWRGTYPSSDLRPLSAEFGPHRLRRRADITAGAGASESSARARYTFQIAQRFRQFSVHDNVALPVQRTLTDGRCAVRLARASWTRSNASGWLAGRIPRAGLWPSALVEVAMGLALKPRLLILDADARAARRRDRDLHSTGPRDRGFGDRAADRVHEVLN